MEELEKLSYMYPSTITIIIVVIALLVLYVTGRSLAYVFKTTEEKLKSEPSVLTELDELRRANKKLSTMYNQLACDPDVLWKENKLKDEVISSYEERVGILETANNRLETHCNEYKDLLDSCMTTLRERDNRIIELEKSLNDAKEQIFGDLSWASYVATDKDESIYAYRNMPEKLSDQWNTIGKYELISLYQAIILCGKEPKWSDDNPTPVVFNTTTADKHIDLSWVNWIAKDKYGKTWAYAEEPIKIIDSWQPVDGRCETINHAQTLHLCVSAPEWNDEKPTYVGKNL